jgi:ElaB/YqjD/DUF883 family membrane-anchored ribosome-binding protein
MTGNHGRAQSADEIRADIERTRERLGDTVEALGEQLNPSLLKQRVKDSVHEATIGKVKTMASNARDKAQESGRSIVETIRDNPIPAAMIAGGIGWLLFGKRRTNSFASAARELPPHPDDETVRSRLASAGEKVKSGVQSAGERVASGASSVASSVADQARAGEQKLEQTFDSNPLVLGAVAAAVGIAVGMTLPASDVESRLMGAKRDELADKAREAVSETRGKVRAMADRAVPEIGNALKEVAREEGLTS